MRQKAQLVIFVTRLSFIFITAGKYLSNEVLVLVQKKHVVLKVLKKKPLPLEKLHQQFIFCSAFRSHWRQQPIKICYDKFARVDHLSCTHCRLNPLCQVSSWKTGGDWDCQTGLGSHVYQDGNDWNTFGFDYHQNFDKSGTPAMHCLSLCNMYWNAWTCMFTTVVSYMCMYHAATFSHSPFQT